MKKQFFYSTMLLFVALALSVVSNTQQTFTPTTPPPPPPDPMDTNTPTNIPFDGGLSILLAAGVGYGVKRIRDQRKQKEKGNL